MAASSEPIVPARPLPRSLTITVIATFLLSAVLLFTGLGHYALWDDEAITAMFGQGVWQTGDTSAVVGHNIVAYQSGLDLKNLRGRYDPPLQYYLAAPFTGPGGPNAFRARLPFALFGLAAVGVLLRWFSRVSRDPLLGTVFCIALLCNVEFFLYSRQCRYYAPAIYFSVAIAYLYYFWDGRVRSLVLFTGCSVLLLAANYLNFAALMVCLATDYVCWGRHRHRLTLRQAVAILLPIIILGGAIVWVWNPFGVQGDIVKDTRPYFGKLILLFWHIRDLNTNQFYSVGLILIAIVLQCTRRRSTAFARGLIALAAYVLVIVVASPQQVESTSGAAVRYLTPVLPLTTVIGVVVVCRMSAGRYWIALPLALLAFGTNVLNGGRFLSTRTGVPITQHAFYSPQLAFAGELIHPPTDPFSVTADWINEHVKDGQSIWVYSEYEQFPLMYHAPQAIYARQLLWPPEPQFAGFPPIYFAGQGVPDYIVTFGPARIELAKKVHFAPDVHYRPIARLDTYFRELYRPELFWRSSQGQSVMDPKFESIYIFERVPPATLP